MIRDITRVVVVSLSNLLITISIIPTDIKVAQKLAHESRMVPLSIYGDQSPIPPLTYDSKLWRVKTVNWGGSKLIEGVLRDTASKFFIEYIY